MPEQLEQAREKAFRSPVLLLAVVDGRRGDPEVDLHERLISAGCAVQNMLLMATALGFGSALTSGKALKSTGLRRLFGLQDGEHALCFVSLGTVLSRKARGCGPARPTICRPWAIRRPRGDPLILNVWVTMEIASFDDLLHAARAQPEPQRLLFVFAGVGCPTTPPRPARALCGRAGGALVPLMCVDKAPEEIASFQALAEESGQFGHDWAMVFVAALSGTLDKLPTSEAEAPCSAWWTPSSRARTAPSSRSTGRASRCALADAAMARTVPLPGFGAAAIGV